MESLSPLSSGAHSAQYPTEANLLSRVRGIAKPELDLEDLFCILQYEPNDSFMALELAKRLRRLSRLEEALAVLRGVLKIDYRFETLFALGHLEYQVDKLDDAFSHLDAALLIAPEEGDDLFELFKTLGNIYIRKGDLDSAEDSYNKAFRLKSNSDCLMVNFGTLAIQRHEWDTALARFRQALELNSSNDKAWVGLALGHRVKGDWELAWGNIEAALSHNPTNEVALNLAAEWAINEGREGRLLELIRTFLVRGGWNEEMSLMFAWLSWRRGDFRLARLELERLLAVNPASEKATHLLYEFKEQNCLSA